MKRLFDLLFSGFFLIVLSPLFALISLLLICLQGRPIFFQQQRVGLKDKIIKIYKFRTMSSARDKNNNLIDPNKRITKIGHWLRKTSLDELPQLYNVFRGDLSLVGPRPLITEYLPLYSKFQARRHECKPGITGWAQVKGRNQLSWQEKFKLDVWYVDHQSFWLDIKILWLTFFKVIKLSDIGNGEQLVMPKFTGNSDKEVQDK